jgi:cold shock CspA family protein
MQKNADQLSQKPFCTITLRNKNCFSKETIDAGQQVHFELYSTNDKKRQKQNVNLDSNNSF